MSRCAAGSVVRSGQPYDSLSAYSAAAAENSCVPPVHVRRLRGKHSTTVLCRAAVFVVSVSTFTRESSRRRHGRVDFNENDQRVGWTRGRRRLLVPRLPWLWPVRHVVCGRNATRSLHVIIIFLLSTSIYYNIFPTDVNAIVVRGRGGNIS